MRRLAKTEAGFGLIELLIAMTVMVIAIMGIVAVFSSGLVALRHASYVSTAGTLADKRMESFRDGSYAAITPTCTTAGTPWSTDCFSPATKTGSDGRNYEIDTAVRFDCALGTLGGTVPGPATCTGASRPVKRVTIVVKDSSTSKQLFTETSTFDQATG